MLFFLLQMKVRTLLCLFSAGFLIFFMVLGSEVLGQIFYPKEKEVTRQLEDSIFQEEIDRVVSGESVAASFPNVPVMVWWTPFSGDVGIQNCGDYSCYVTNDHSFLHHPNLKNIFFYGTSVREVDMPLPRNGLDWSILHEESPKNNQLFSHQDTMVLFNHTSTFRIGSDLPLTTQYLEGLDSIVSSTFAVNVQDKNRYMREEGLASVVYVQSGCDAPLHRDLWVKEFMKHVPVDSYGSCLHNKDLPDSLVGSEQMDNQEFYSLLSKYKFMLTLENAECPDYVTEKFWRAIEIGVVPIYLGAQNIRDYLPNPLTAVLIDEHSSVKEVADLVIKLNKDDKAYSDYLVHKIEHKVENQLLKKILKERGWGVSSLQQMELGNSVKHFQCLVCNRVAANVKFTNMGFNRVRYKADVSHYGCPIPTHPITKQVDKENWYVQEWHRTKYASSTLREWAENRGDVINPAEFRNISMEKWRRDLVAEGAMVH